MEAVHKELFGEDDLEVAVRMQSGKFIGPIGERYLYYYYKSSKLSKTVNNSDEKYPFVVIFTKKYFPFYP